MCVAAVAYHGEEIGVAWLSRRRSHVGVVAADMPALASGGLRHGTQRARPLGRRPGMVRDGEERIGVLVTVVALLATTVAKFATTYEQYFLSQRW